MAKYQRHKISYCPVCGYVDLSDKETICDFCKGKLDNTDEFFDELCSRLEDASKETVEEYVRQLYIYPDSRFDRKALSDREDDGSIFDWVDHYEELTLNDNEDEYTGEEDFAVGGFRFNGCGVTDHFKHIKSLGTHVCPNCKKLAEFTLDEANQKIDVFWIPTFTLKSRYAVMCGKCKNGEFCSVEWAGFLMMNQGLYQDILFESTAKAKGWSAETRSFQQLRPQQNTQPTLSGNRTEALADQAYTNEFRQNSGTSQNGSDVQPKITYNGGRPSFLKCSYCGVTQMQEGNFCSYCGKPTRQNAPEGNSITCDQCGLVQEKHLLVGGKRCYRCGRLLAAAQPQEKRCPDCGAKVNAGMLFCMECGTKL